MAFPTIAGFGTDGTWAVVLTYQALQPSSLGIEDI